jgi:polycomb group RING finger protein 3
MSSHPDCAEISSPDTDSACSSGGSGSLNKNSIVKEDIKKPDTSVPEQSESYEDDNAEEEDDGKSIEPILDGRNITFKTRILNQYLLCSLCMGYFKDAHTIMECLHTYCKSCIYRHFMENTECPTCGISLRPFPMQAIRVDRTLQSIVDKIFPDMIRKDLEAEERFYIERGMPVPEYVSEQLEQQSKAQPTAHQEAAPPPTKRLKKGEAHKRIYNDEVAFELALDESGPEGTFEGLPKLDKPFIRTSAKITVFHLKKFLTKKLNLKSLNDVEITYRGEVLGSEHSLEYILKTRGLDPNAKGPIFKYRKKKADLVI